MSALENDNRNLSTNLNTSPCTHTPPNIKAHKYIVLLDIGRMLWRIVHISHLEDFNYWAGKCSQNYLHTNNGNLCSDTYLL